MNKNCIISFIYAYSFTMVFLVYILKLPTLVTGNTKLVELVENVSSTASIEQVANLISDKFIRRQLIKSGNEVVQLGFDQTQKTNKNK